jgi:hypothetical protein
MIEALPRNRKQLSSASSLAGVCFFEGRRENVTNRHLIVRPDAFEIRWTKR